VIDYIEPCYHCFIIFFILDVMSILVFGLVLRCVLLRSPGARRAVRPLAPGSFLPSIFQLAKQGEPRDLSLPNPVYRQRLATDIRFLLLVALSIFCSRERIHFLARQVRWRHPWPLIFILNVCGCWVLMLVLRAS
jgi:hypothetical protein